MALDLRVADIMTTDVLAFRPDDPVGEAARALLSRGVGGAPVVDAEGRVIGLLEDDDLIVSESRLHIPTAITILGAYIELPSSVHHFEDDLRKAVGATVGDVMDASPPTCSEDDTVEEVTTRMHERNIRRLPVVREGHLVGIVARGDVLRAMVTGGELPAE